MTQVLAVPSLNDSPIPFVSNFDQTPKKRWRIIAKEFRTLNRCLDSAIADAVKSFGSAHEVLLEDQAETLHQRLHYYSLEHRRLINIALQAYAAIKSGQVGATGATSTLLVKTLEDLRSLTDRTLPEIHRAYDVAIP